MGLDMYAFTMTAAPDNPVDFKTDAAEKIHYWRKHPNLHGWMERLYRLKGGVDPDFNCVTLLLTLADLDALERDITARSLPRTTGFFFGQSDGNEIADDLRFVARAREAIAEGLTVFYTSWW